MPSNHSSSNRIERNARGIRTLKFTSNPQSGRLILGQTCNRRTSAPLGSLRALRPGAILLKACRTCLDDRDVALDVAYLCLFKTRFVDYSARCIFNPHVTRSGSKGGGVLQHVFSCVAKNRSDIAAAVSSLHVPSHSSHQGKLCVQSNHSPRSSKSKLMHHLHARVLACFRGRWPDLKIAVAGFELGLVSA